ncbi:MAG: 23S rRNA (adenine(2503)-C(2))-methyltransferase RlmN [Firmicutes bacterium]|nr:23S rRNA (adenine(2503)-C(2))-methyltransferase RlmN [Bacillota bacterium]
MEKEMQDLYDLTLEEMKTYVTGLGEKPFRAGQVYRWLYQGVSDFGQMRNVPQALRARLEEEALIGSLTILKKQSASDGTRKYLFRLADGNTIESVFMRYSYGNSLCVSSQAGCRMGCRFCASQMKGLARNLTAGEILGQLKRAQADTGEKVDHIVVMGSGEPFDNYAELARFLTIVHEKEGLNLSRRNITVSTCGLVPGIERFGKEFPQVNLAISLHAPSDEIRQTMMPVNRRYPLAEVVAAAKKHAEMTGRRVTFEYALVNGVNDRDEDARALIRLLSGLLCHVNLIPLNKVEGTGFDTVSRARAYEFMELLTKGGIPATVRRELGAEIDAACGQLRLNG